MKTGIILLSLLVFGLNNPSMVGAQSTQNPEQEQETNLNPTYNADFKTSELLTALNPAEKFDNSDTLVGDLLSAALPYTIVFAGMILTLFIVMGGYQLLTSPTNPQGQEAGKNKITWAIIGFLVIFSAYWIMQILEVIFGFNVLGGTTGTGGVTTPNSSAPNYVNTTPPANSPSCQGAATCEGCLKTDVCYNNPNSSATFKFVCCGATNNTKCQDDVCTNELDINITEGSTCWCKTGNTNTCSGTGVNCCSGILKFQPCN